MFPLQPRIFLPVAASFAFLGLAFFIGSGHSFTLDTRLVLLLRAANDPATSLGPLWLQEGVRDLTAFGSFVGLGIFALAAGSALWLCGYRRLAIGLWLSILTAALISTGLKILVGRERPDIVAPSALTFTASFPSGHAFLSAVTLLGIAGFTGLASCRADIARLSLWLAWILIVLIGVSRIYLGVHWPSDVLAGWCLGVAWSSLAVAWAGKGLDGGYPR